VKSLILIILIAALSLPLSCTRSGTTVQPKNIIVLVDFSLSRDTANIRWYMETIARYVVDNMGPKDRIIILPLDFNSETSSTEIFRVDFSKNDYSSEFAGLQKDEMEKQNHLDSVQSAIQQFKQLFEIARQKRALLRGGTDIFGGLKICRKYYVPGSRNILVICSDMLQFTDRNVWNFEEHLTSKDEVEHYLSIAEKVDLQGMQTVVLTGAQDSMRPEKFNAVKAFWEAYFIKCNDTIVDYSSGAVSKLEELISQ